MSEIRTFYQRMQKDKRKMQILRKKSWYENAYVFNMQIDRIMFSHIVEMCELRWSTCIKQFKLRAFQSNWNQIKKKRSFCRRISDTITQKIRFLQHNCAKFTNTMISCLEYDIEKKINIICMQKSWIESNQVIISHSTFNRILSEQKKSHKQRVITFVSKSFKFSVTSRSNLCMNTNIQISTYQKQTLRISQSWTFITRNIKNQTQINTQLKENWEWLS